MTLKYTFVKNCKDYDYEFEADNGEVFEFLKHALAKDSYDIYEVDDCVIDEYTDLLIDDIKELFYDKAHEEWQESMMSPYEYYGISRDYFR